MSPRPHDDEGMTLIELLISITVLAIVVYPITMVLEFASGASNSASHRTTDSAGAQLLSSYLVTDVQSSDFVWTFDQHTNFAQAIPQVDASKPLLPTTQCGDNTNTRLELQGRDASSTASPPAVNAVTYDVVPGGSGADSSFVRRTWSVGSGSCTLVTTTTLVSAVDATQLPTAVCDPTSCVAPNSVRLTVHALSQDVHNSTLYTAYTFDLSATRRTG